MLLSDKRKSEALTRNPTSTQNAPWNTPRHVPYGERTVQCHRDRSRHGNYESRDLSFSEGGSKHLSASWFYKARVLFKQDLRACGHVSSIHVAFYERLSHNRSGIVNGGLTLQNTCSPTRSGNSRQHLWTMTARVRFQVLAWGAPDRLFSMTHIRKTC